MNFPKACKILGINESSNLDAETVRKQYKMMALKYHPDKNKSFSTKYEKIYQMHSTVSKLYVKMS